MREAVQRPAPLTTGDAAAGTSGYTGPLENVGAEYQAGSKHTKLAAEALNLTSAQPAPSPMVSGQSKDGGALDDLKEDQATLCGPVTGRMIFYATDRVEA